MKSLSTGFTVLAVAVVVFGLAAPAFAADSSGQDAAADRAASGRMRARCQNNLKQMGLVFKMFANESPGQQFPALSPQAGRLMFDNDGVGKAKVYPEFLTDMSVLMCPADKDKGILKDSTKQDDPVSLIDDHSYYYLGYVVMNEEDLKTFAKAYKERIAKGLKFDEDLTDGDHSVRLLREGVERFIITDINDPAAGAKAQSGIPLLIERPDNHEPEGGNVLFMDGHVEYVRYSDNGKWPMTKAFMKTMKSLEAVKAPEGSGKK